MLPYAKENSGEHGTSSSETNDARDIAFRHCQAATFTAEGGGSVSACEKYEQGDQAKSVVAGWQLLSASLVSVEACNTSLFGCSSSMNGERKSHLGDVRSKDDE
jgi:hypothetical protein